MKNSPTSQWFGTKDFKINKFTQNLHGYWGLKWITKTKYELNLIIILILPKFLNNIWLIVKSLK